ncbi:hypothetical protein Plec18167_000825 [Paecilomyces lecythidis]|uniref:Elongator complex protein 5 n=1 Tax=Paecilomyces lecythidis TaxID=3004212 RepID=A0ABR3YFZ7_9EURO
MAPTNLSHRRTHNLLLISKLLSLRDTVSPLTLLLDSLEQPARPLIQEYIRRAKLSKVHITLVAFETLQRPEGVDAFISCRRKRTADIAKEVVNAYPTPAPGTTPRRRLILIDSIHPLLSARGNEPPVHLPSYLGSFVAPTTPTATPIHASLVVTYHQDIPLPPNPQPYTPSALSLLTYLATSIITLHSLSHILAQKAARDRSLAAPVFGLEEEQDGVILGRLDHVKGVDKSAEGVVLEMEHRRKSGRGVVEWYVLPPASQYHPQQAKEIVTLLDDHPLYRRPEELEDNAGEEEPGSTFELRLTERQRREREGVVLPYFDAQHGDGPGEGGRILYDMGEEDDFDEEEDEI